MMGEEAGCEREGLELLQYCAVCVYLSTIMM